MSFSALILAAGQGTRMKSARSKVVHEILGVPMVSLVYDAAVAAGAKRTIAIVGHNSHQVEELFAENPDVVIVHQEQQIGTANAVAVAQDALKDQTGYLVVLSGDTPLMRPETITSLVDACASQGAAMSILTAVVDNPFGYGRIIRSEGDVTAIVEQKDATPQQLDIKETNTGTYCFALDGLWERLGRIGNANAAGEYYLTDIVDLCISDGQRVVAVPAHDSEEAMGVNSRVQLAQASAVLQKRINTAWMEQGVTMISPETVWISPYTTFENDVEVWPNSYVLGATSVKRNTVIGPDARIVDSTIGEGVCIDSSIVLESAIGDGAAIGPRAYVRPGCEIGPSAKIGTSVEVKKSKVGKGSKIPHLSYVGDATIGENCNLGAGTITCNYDGYIKSRTILGDNVFIGSDTMLVAPVTIENGATIGAGSVITHDVPADALAVERSEQRVVEGWAARKRSQQH